MNKLQRYVREQFGRPRGPLGQLAGHIMASRSSNVERNRWTVDLLNLDPDARVLELGYGPGVGIEAALQAAPDGQVIGIDHSPTMRAAAIRRNRRAVRSGRAQLLIGDAQNPPDLGPFDAIFGCNVWLFWPDPTATLRRLKGLLAANGLLAITQLPRTGAPGPAETQAEAALIETQMRQAGLAVLGSQYLHLEPTPAVCVTGQRSDHHDVTVMDRAASSPALPTSPIHH